MSTITFRTDPEIDKALAELGGENANKSDVIREAILTARRQRRRELLLEESRKAASDPVDLAAMREVMEDMEALRAR
ncbi:MAG: hypothetical protein ACRDWI_05335 [Jiangellaceae bacterium]